MIKNQRLMKRSNHSRFHFFNINFGNKKEARLESLLGAC
jgi:hypothetical protein